MSDLKLDREELEILASYENQEWQSVKELKENTGKYQAYAHAMSRKDHRINIRISEKDLMDLQEFAVHEGIPYQTLIASILHKYVNGSLCEKPG